MNAQVNGQSSLEPSAPLEAVLREVETHVADQGWDQHARLYALVPTGELVTREPGLADVLDIPADLPESHLTPVEQELPSDGRTLEQVLATVEWPGTVHGCAAVVERLVLPPEAEGALPEGDAAAAEFAQEHPDRQEVRIAAGALRTGAAFTLLRLRAHDDAQSVVGGTDLVPALLHLLSSTLTEEPPA